MNFCFIKIALWHSYSILLHSKNALHLKDHDILERQLGVFFGKIYASYAHQVTSETPTFLQANLNYVFLLSKGIMLKVDICKSGLINQKLFWFKDQEEIVYDSCMVYFKQFQNALNGKFTKSFENILLSTSDFIHFFFILVFL